MSEYSGFAIEKPRKIKNLMVLDSRFFYYISYFKFALQYE